MATQQKLVTDYFQKSARFWNDVYTQSDVYSVIYQKRRDAVICMVDKLALETGLEVLDVGCGAGGMSVALASRGFRVSSVDQVPEMIDLTRRTASHSGVASNITASLGDIQHLAFPNRSFTLALAIGVFPWLNDYDAALNEIARVIKPNGYFIASIDNRWALHRILNPEMNFMLSPLRRGVGRSLRALHLWKRKAVVASTLVSSKRFNSMLRRSGFEPQTGIMVGFGPFSVFSRNVFPGSFGLELDNKLQQLCDRGLLVLRSMGAHYVVLARKR